MDWFVSLILAPVISGLAGRLPDLLGDELRTRGTIRAQEHQARLIEIAERRTVAARTAHLREAHQREVLLERYRSQAAHYPLGVIGRLAQKARDGRPAVLISPVEWAGSPAARLPGYVHDALREVAEFPEYADLHTGAFVAGRTIGGSVAAEEISALEFPGYPAILVYFEADGAHLNAFAHLGSLLPTVDGAAGFSIQVARFGLRGPRPTVVDDGGLPTWQYVNLTEVEQPAEQVVAAVVAWFVLTCLELHWKLRGFGEVDLRGSLLKGQEAAMEPLPPTGEDVFGCRVEMELRTLELDGFEPATTEYGEDQIALMVSDDGLQVAFVLGPDYPVSPPEVFYVSGDDQERLTIDPGCWSPERTLLELVEGLRAEEGL